MAIQPTEYYIKNILGEYEPVHFKTDAGLVKVEDSGGFFSKDNAEEVLGEVGASLAEISQIMADQFPTSYPFNLTIKEDIVFKHTDGTPLVFRTYCPVNKCLYATIGWGGVLRSDDKGASWSITKRFQQDTTPKYPRDMFTSKTGAVFVVCAVGTIDSTDYRLYRSTDKGVNWTEVLAFTGQLNILGYGAAEHPTWGLYIAEYKMDNDAVPYVYLHRSTDDGATWAIAKQWNHVKLGTGAEDIRHMHFVQYDPYENCMWAGTGDEDSQCRLYKSTDGSTWTIFGSGTQKWRAVSILFDKTYIYMPTDAVFTTADRGAVYRIHRTTKVIEKIGNMTSLSWYSTTLADGKQIAISTVQTEALDNYVKIWDIDYTGVKEVARWQATPNCPLANIQRIYQDADDPTVLYANFIFLPMLGVAGLANGMGIRLMLKEVRPFSS
ncbi:MAG TPA: sialidase family protein [Clostridia bacterium]|nr:sialidase family protein [Clostridia bacterium]